MTAAYDYIGRRHAQAHAEGIELDRVNADIAGMKAQLEKLNSNLDAAEQYVEDECKRNSWPLPEDPEVEPAPSPIELIARASVDTGPERTLAFEAVKVATPVAGEGGAYVCGRKFCGLELIHENGVWIHTTTGLQMCQDQTTDPALQEGTDGDPTKRTALPPHIAAEVTREEV